MSANQAAPVKPISTASGELRSLNHGSVDQSTGYLIRKTFRAFTRSLEHRLAPHDVSLSMWFFLRLLWERDGLTQKELSDELGLTQATTVAAMDVMESRGLIERYRSQEDRRRTHIHLTAEGRALKRRLLPYAFEVNKAALANVTIAEIMQLWGILKRINQSLDADHEHLASGDLSASRARRNRASR